MNKLLHSLRALFDTPVQSKERSRSSKIREFILSVSLVGLGVATAGATHLELESKILVLAAFLGCVLYRLSEDRPLPAVLRKRPRK